MSGFFNNKVDAASVAAQINIVNTKLANQEKSLGEIGVNVKDKLFGAKGDWNGTTGTDDTQAFKNALLVANSPAHTLIIPDGKYLITDKIEINCNIQCNGEIIVPNDVVKSFVLFPSGEKATFSGDVAFNTIQKGQGYLDLKALSGIPANTLSDYYYHITSTEELIKRLGDTFTLAHSYTKNESGSIKQVSGGKALTLTPLLYGYNDLTKASLKLSKKLPYLNVRGLKVRRISRGTNTSDQRLVHIQRNNINFSDLYVNNESLSALASGVRIEETAGIRFDGLEIKNIFGIGDYYSLLNVNSCFIYLNNYTYSEISDSVTPRRGYNGRHGNYVYFYNCELNGIDDHYGSNYFINSSKLVGRGVSFAGQELHLYDTDFINCEFSIDIRNDTPHATGNLIIDNCTFDSCMYIVYYQAALDTTKVLGFEPHFFDNMEFRNVKVINSGLYSADLAGYRGLLSTSRNGGLDQIVHIGKITYANIQSDVALFNMPQSCKFIIGEISVNNCEHTKPSLLARRGFVVNPDTTRKHEINKIKIRNSDNMSCLVSANSVVKELIYKDCSFNIDSDANYQFASPGMKVHLDGCDVGLGVRFTNTVPVGIKNCIFKGVRTTHVLSITANILYSKGNIAEIDTPNSYIPQLDAYVNASFYKATNV